MKQRKRLIERLVRRIFYRYYSQNLLYELQIRARNEAVDYIQGNMNDAMIWESQKDIINHAKRESSENGLVAEFGVATGKSVNLIASLFADDQTVFGFDTFEGLPKDWKGHLAPKGEFRQKTLPKLNKNVELVVGLFEETLPSFVKKIHEDVRFIHIDCDLYSSTKTILDNLNPKITVGSVILFDEYFNYPAWKKHEFLAWQEFCKKNKVNYEYLAFTASGSSVLVRVTKRKALE
jgi:hypothetical protein